MAPSLPSSSSSPSSSMRRSNSHQKQTLAAATKEEEENAEDTTIVQRFVPKGDLSSDAPGWFGTAAGAAIASAAAGASCAPGPTCWKCKGLGHVLCRRNNKRARKKRKREKERRQDKKDDDKDDDEKDDEDAAVEQKEEEENAETPSRRRCCPVCQGKGYLLPKQRDAAARSSSSLGGMITRRRQRPSTWKEFGPVAYALQQMERKRQGQEEEEEEEEKDGGVWHHLALAQQDWDAAAPAQQGNKAAGIVVSSASASSFGGNTKPPPPPWFPVNFGEELCNLVGNWRILQRVASHRWTTDDLMTAHVAALQWNRIFASNGRTTKVRYLDLGCGNGSVLLMVLWSLLQQEQLEVEVAYGIEAREEAVALARRSLSFNVATSENEDDEEEEANDNDVLAKKRRTEKAANDKEEKEKKETKRVPVQVIHGDFRQLSCPSPPSSSSPHNKRDDHDDDKKKKKISLTRFHVITGTPPYFGVHFQTNKKKKKQVVESAVSSQGGMPTSIQSAPARCEFRGGIEAYCQAASLLLEEKAGCFVVCENGLNHERVQEAAALHKLHTIAIYPVRGKVGREQDLFCVYVLTHKQHAATTHATPPPPPQEEEEEEEETIVHPPLHVRDETGKWTREYAHVLESFSIPALHLAAAAAAAASTAATTTTTTTTSSSS